MIHLLNDNTDIMKKIRNAFDCKHQKYDGTIWLTRDDIGLEFVKLYHIITYETLVDNETYAIVSKTDTCDLAYLKQLLNISDDLYYVVLPNDTIDGHQYVWADGLQELVTSLKGNRDHIFMRIDTMFTEHSIAISHDINFLASILMVAGTGNIPEHSIRIKYDNT